MNIEPTNRYWWNWSITTTECHYSRQKTTSASARSMSCHMATVDAKNTAIPWAIPQNGRRPVWNVAEPPCKISRRSLKPRLKNPLLHIKRLAPTFLVIFCLILWPPPFLVTIGLTLPDLIMSKLTKPPATHPSQFKLSSTNVPQWWNCHKIELWPHPVRSWPWTLTLDLRSQSLHLSLKSKTQNIKR